MGVVRGIIQTKRQEKSITRAALAKRVGVTPNHIYMVERGGRTPSLKLLQDISDVIDVPLQTLMQELRLGEEEQDGGVYYDYARDHVELLEKLQRERRMRLLADERVIEQERRIEHMTIVLHLYVQLTDIFFEKGLSDREKSGKIKKLAEVTAREGEVTFDEMLAAFHAKRATLKGWVESVKQIYKCKYVEGYEVLAANPGEACLRFCCFDCEYFASQECYGYGDERKPDNIIELLARLEANGVYNRREQAQLLEESYHVTATEHELCEAVYRSKTGQKIPEWLFNLESRPK